MFVSPELFQGNTYGTKLRTAELTAMGVLKIAGERSFVYLRVGRQWYNSTALF